MRRDVILSQRCTAVEGFILRIPQHFMHDSNVSQVLQSVIVVRGNFALLVA